MFLNKLLSKCLIAAVALSFAACKNDDNNVPEEKTPVDSVAAKYVLGLGVTSNNVTANYVVTSDSLTGGVISPVGNGLTLVGYRDYSIGNNTVFALGGLGEANVNGITQDASGELTVSGSATFDASADDMQQVNDKQMLALKYPSAAEGNQASFYLVDIDKKSIANKYSTPLAPLVMGGDNPVYSGMVVRGNQLFVSHLHFDAMYNTNHVDTNYVAVYSFPEIKFEKLIKDPRTGPTGAWQTKNGLFKTENNDIYAMSSSNISNGYSKSTKPGGFLRIKSGQTEFDKSYFFNTELGGKISHIKYVGNGLVFATVSTIQNQTADNRWGDKDLKMVIFDVNKQTVKDVTVEGTTGPLIHNGNGGRSFPVLVEGGKVYYPITTANGTFVYEVDIQSATAKKGAEVQATFVGGIFKIK